ncbi:hypothetical protein HWV07_10255 [Natronomonas salina]|uniref:DUF7344 domain-containing protein n=1 Tax=Natronomonas salina TaxID=1710540 RepID=UPI0015B3DFA9|nr:hypothetical protein [Natronomonas salina]QLD89390.1 hypothetical protein HWV07_10255 [Natronomonas salina]
MTQLDSQFAASDPAVADGLSNARRRGTLAVLREAGAPLALADLAADLVDREAGPVAGAPDYDAIQRQYVILYHTHVPKLVEAGLVEFDADRRIVSLGS